MTGLAGRRRGKKTSTSIWAKLGSMGGRARALRLSAKERRRIAMMGVQARLAKRKLKKLGGRLRVDQRGGVRLPVAKGKTTRKRRARSRRK